MTLNENGTHSFSTLILEKNEARNFKTLTAACFPNDKFSYFTKKASKYSR